MQAVLVVIDGEDARHDVSAVAGATKTIVEILALERPAVGQRVFSTAAQSPRN